MTSTPRTDSTAGAGKPMRRRGGNIYFIASLTAQIAALLRYVSLARILGPEQLGLAATLVVTSAFFDFISDTGSDRFIVQDPQGDSPEVQKLLHLVAVGRGVIIALLLVVLAGPIAAIYKQPGLVVGLPFLGLAPIILGFAHLDTRRLQRRHDFRADAISMIAAEGVSLMVTVVAAWLTRNYTAILYGLIARALVAVLVSHLRAERPFALGWSRAHAPRMWAFAGPLLLNGFTLFVGSQGDRLMVANQLGVKTLGEYSAVLLLVYYPTAVLLRFMFGIFLPQMAGARDNPQAYDTVRNTLGGQTLLLSVGMAVGFAVVAPTMTTLLYGGRYTQSALIVGLIGLLQTTRFMIVWPTGLALGMGDSRAVLTSNLARLSVFPAAIIGLKLIGGLTGVVVGFALGELFSINVAMILANRATRYPMWAGFDRLAMFVLTGLTIVGWNLAIANDRLVAEIALAAVSIILASAIAVRERTVIQSSARTIERLARPLLSRAGT